MDLIHQQPYVLGNQVEAQRDRKKVKEKEEDVADEKISPINSSLISYMVTQ
tara:strand:+ start:50 stop:202 length:153 start_codon:yes stop_codon:yes gene_type:complete